MVIKAVLRRALTDPGKDSLAVRFPDGATVGNWDTADVQIAFLNKRTT